jgi:hypothetical protein
MGGALRWGLGVALVIGTPGQLTAHPGGLNAEGCHNDRKNGGYHCHRAPTRQATPAPSRSRPLGLLSAARAFPNCTAARAAGAAPVRRGDPGYGQHLDRDNDGIGCE